MQTRALDAGSSSMSQARHPGHLLLLPVLLLNGQAVFNRGVRLKTPEPPTRPGN
jgi:hypothetical protein